MTKTEIEEMIDAITPQSSDSEIERATEGVSKYYAETKKEILERNNALLNSIIAFCDELETLGDECRELYGTALRNGETGLRNTSIRNESTYWLYQSHTTELKKACIDFNKGKEGV